MVELKLFHFLVKGSFYYYYFFLYLLYLLIYFTFFLPTTSESEQMELQVKGEL